MASTWKRKGKQDEQVFFTDNLTEADKKRLNAEFQKKDTDLLILMQKLFDNELSLKVSWSDYNDSFTATVSPISKDHPSAGTFYSAFHSDWKKAVFIVVFLLGDRYDFGDWAKDRGNKFDNAW